VGSLKGGYWHVDSFDANYGKDPSTSCVVLFAHQTNRLCWNQVKVLLSGERKNCDQIFDGITSNKDQCFAELAGSSVMALLSFGDTVAKSKRSHENLFVLLDMYGVMHELQSEVCGNNALSTLDTKIICVHITMFWPQELLWLVLDI
jgi:hypothetical protein